MGTLTLRNTCQGQKKSRYETETLNIGQDIANRLLLISLSQWLALLSARMEIIGDSVFGGPGHQSAMARRWRVTSGETFLNNWGNIPQ